MRGNCTPGSCVATGCNSLVVQVRYCSSFQLTHMSCDDHAWSIKSAMAGKGKTRTYYSAHNYRAKQESNTKLATHKRDGCALSTEVHGHFCNCTNSALARPNTDDVR